MSPPRFLLFQNLSLARRRMRHLSLFGCRSSPNKVRRRPGRQTLSLTTSRLRGFAVLRLCGFAASRSRGFAADHGGQTNLFTETPGLAASLLNALTAGINNGRSTTGAASINDVSEVALRKSRQQGSKKSRLKSGTAKQRVVLSEMRGLF